MRPRFNGFPASLVGLECGIAGKVWHGRPAVGPARDRQSARIQGIDTATTIVLLGYLYSVSYIRYVYTS